VENGTGEQTGDGLVVFAYDGSDEAKNAIREAGRQLRSGRDAIVLSVWQPLATVPFAGVAGGGTPDVEESIEAEARKVAAEGAELARSAGFAATPLVVSGSPIWHTIVTTAEEHDANIVVMGSHGRTGINLVLMGSVAAAVVRHTERPTLIVHARRGERDD
jgi:nucleotide-binding universal stress UspA family protein